MLGARLYDNGVLNYARDGVKYYRYDSLDNEYICDKIPLFSSRGEYEKVVLSGGKTRAKKLLLDTKATVVKVEQIDGLTVLYAHSPVLSKCVVVGEKKINITIAYASDVVVVGTPLIKGSF